MSDDELQAIEYWKEKLKDYKKEIEQRQNDEFKGYGTLEDIAKLKYCNLHIMLNLIERQQREKELHIKLEQQYKKEYLDAKERIKELQTTLATYTAHTVCSDIKQSYKHKEDLEMLYKGCQIEIEKKDKIIALMANEIEAFDGSSYCKKKLNDIDCTSKDCSDCIKEYFKKKVEENK